MRSTTEEADSWSKGVENFLWKRAEVGARPLNVGYSLIFYGSAEFSKPGEAKRMRED